MEKPREHGDTGMTETLSIQGEVQSASNCRELARQTLRMQTVTSVGCIDGPHMMQNGASRVQSPRGERSTGHLLAHKP